MERNRYSSVKFYEYPHNGQVTRGGIKGGFRNICFTGTAVALPLVVLSIALVALVKVKEVQPNAPSVLFTVPSQADASVYFVNISAPTFLTIASWSSSVAQAVTALAITLLSFPVARMIKRSSLYYQDHELPTPFQLSLILGFLQTGGFGALWSWLKYQFGWQGRRVKISGPLKSSVLVTLAVLFLG